MKRWTVTAVIGVLLLGLVAAVSDEDLKKLSVSAEQARLTELGVTQTEPGNAAETYAAYLMDKAPIVKAEWFFQVTWSKVETPKDQAEKDLIAKGVKEAGADLDLLVAAGKRKDYQFWGPFWKPDPKANALNPGIPSYFTLTRLVSLLAARGKDLEAQGNATAAAEQYLAVVRIGNHLEREPIGLGYMFGMGLKKHGAQALAALYEKGNPELAGKWKKYVEILDPRRAIIKMFFKDSAQWPPARAEAFIRNTDMPTSLRLEVLSFQNYCGQSTTAAAKCKALGPPDWVKKLKKEAPFSDPQAKIILPLMENSASWQDIMAIFLAQEE